MKNLSKKVLVLALVLILALSICMLAACNKDDKEDTTLTLLYEQDDSLMNTYTMIAVEPTRVSPAVLNTAGADAFIKWMSLASTRDDFIKTYGVENYNEALFYLKTDAPLYNGTLDSLAYTTGEKTIKVSTTTSVNDTGLLGYLGEKFKAQTGWEIAVTSAGTGKAIQNAKDGNADMLLVHAKAQEDAFVEDGYARTVSGFTSARISFMYNYFVLVGPKNDPAGVKDCATIIDGFKAIKNTQSKFVSRGDNSGTHTKEINLWKSAGETGIGWDTATSSAVYPAEYTWYTAAAAGMMASLNLAEENQAYILSDKGTYLAYKKSKAA